MNESLYIVLYIYSVALGMLDNVSATILDLTHHNIKLDAWYCARNFSREQTQSTKITKLKTLVFPQVKTTYALNTGVVFISTSPTIMK